MTGRGRTEMVCGVGGEKRGEGRRAFVKESMEVGFSTSFAGIFILMALSLRAEYPDDILRF